MTDKVVHLSLTVHLNKDIQDMTDIFANRIYTIDGVTDCAVTQDVEPETLDSKIVAFNRMYKLPVGKVPGMFGDRDTIRQRIDDFMSILVEEVMEGRQIVEEIDAGEHPMKVLTDIADWLGDIQVYCMSEMCKFGIPSELVLGIIMASNMSKLSETGEPLYDERGKVLKGPKYWRPEPQIERTLVALIRQGKDK